MTWYFICMCERGMSPWCLSVSHPREDGSLHLTMGRELHSHCPQRGSRERPSTAGEGMPRDVRYFFNRYGCASRVRLGLCKTAKDWLAQGNQPWAILCGWQVLRGWEVLYSRKRIGDGRGRHVLTEPDRLQKLSTVSKEKVWRQTASRREACGCEWGSGPILCQGPEAMG